jgi:hypothetical protein
LLSGGVFEPYILRGEVFSDLLAATAEGFELFFLIALNLEGMGGCPFNLKALLFEVMGKGMVVIGSDGFLLNEQFSTI